MKKSIKFLMILLLMISFVSCKQNKDNDNSKVENVKKEDLKFGLTENQRKQLFKDIVSAEDKANKYKFAEQDKALEKELNKNELKKEYDRIDKETEKLMTEYKSEVLKKYNITIEQEKKISEEAFKKNWPLD